MNPPEAKPPRGRSGESADETPSDDLAQLMRQELYRRGQAAGVVGPSEMSKQQLIAALRNADG